MFTTIILFTVGGLLIFLNYKAIKKEKESFKGILGEASDNMEEFEVEIGKLRREFAETLLELQTQVVDLEKKLESNLSVDDKVYVDTNKEILEKSLGLKEKQSKSTEMDIYEGLIISKRNSANIENVVENREETVQEEVEEKTEVETDREVEADAELGVDREAEIEEVVDEDKNEIENKDIKDIEFAESEENKEDTTIKDNKNSIKIKEIEKLLKQGMSVEEVADTLKISKGEILLIKELYLE